MVQSLDRSQGRAGSVSAGSVNTYGTYTGNRALQLEEPLIFEMGQAGRCGVDLPADEGGYRQWREAADRGEAGVFTLTLAELLDLIGRAVAPAPVGGLFGKSNRR